MGAFVRRIPLAIAERPHLLLAYMHIFYLALFSGGRYIRSELRAADNRFWNGREPDEALGFWCFDGGDDGEDLRMEFKRRFAEVQEGLSWVEREEVVGEAVNVMRSMIEVVEEMAGVLGGGGGGGLDVEDRLGQSVGREGKQGMEDDHLSVHWLLLKHLFPMGLVELLTASTAVFSTSCLGDDGWGPGEERRGRKQD